MCARARIETKLRPTEEQVGKKWDSRTGRFLRVLKPTGERVCEKLGRFQSRVMSPGRQARQQEDRRLTPRVGVGGAGDSWEASQEAGQCPGCSCDNLGGEDSTHGGAKVNKGRQRRKPPTSRQPLQKTSTREGPSSTLEGKKEPECQTEGGAESKRH